MTAQCLNAKQQRKALLRKKLSVKTVLASPFQPYWPQVSNEDKIIVEKALDSYLPKLKNENIKILYKDIKNVPKPERAEFRANYMKQNLENYTEINKEERSGLSIGVNAVTKLLETNEAASIIVAADVKPKLMVQHIIDMAVMKCPIIIMPQLRDILKRKTGVSSVSIAFKKQLKSEDKLYQIHETVCNISKKYPPPSSHINAERSVTLKENENKEESVKKDEKVDEIKPQDKYLYRNSKTERVFIPKLKTIKSTFKPEMQDFIAFNTAPKASANIYNYIESEVNRIRANKIRRKKIASKIKCKKTNAP